MIGMIHCLHCPGTVHAKHSDDFCVYILYRGRGLGSVSHHEHIKLIQHSEGTVGSSPQGKQEAHSGVGPLSTRQGSCVSGHPTRSLHLCLRWEHLEVITLHIPTHTKTAYIWNRDGTVLM